MAPAPTPRPFQRFVLFDERPRGTEPCFTVPGNFSGKIASPPTAEQVPVLKAFFAPVVEPSPVNPSDAVEAQASAAEVPVESPVLAKK